MNSICRTLANEEKDVTFVSLRPGMVDTEMQANLRRDGPGHMLPNELTRFTKSYEEGTLVKPKDCGHVIAALAVSATSDLSGQFINWDSPEMASYRKS
ncbi:hypothetical protein FRC02_005507 [Tulasnella sp. 418]|nr:hypothetical protein FRC02_005507 [Tulasnella sp. 418]